MYARLFSVCGRGTTAAVPLLPRVEARARSTLTRVRSRGYSFMEEILFWCRQVGCTIGETPIIFENRRAGVSKINKYEAYMALRIIFELGVGRVLGTTKVK